MFLFWITSLECFVLIFLCSLPNFSALCHFKHMFAHVQTTCPSPTKTRINALKVKVEVAQSCVGSLSLLQGIFPTQGLNLGLPHCRWILYLMSHQGSPLYIYWCVSVNPKLLIYPSLPFPFGNYKFVLYVCGSLSVL